jgi:hypothetical protein
MDKTLPGFPGLRSIEMTVLLLAAFEMKKDQKIKSKFKNKNKTGFQVQGRRRVQVQVQVLLVEGGNVNQRINPLREIPKSTPNYRGQIPHPCLQINAYTNPPPSGQQAGAFGQANTPISPSTLRTASRCIKEIASSRNFWTRKDDSFQNQHINLYRFRCL